MKKILAIALAAMMVFAMIACTGSNPAETKPAAETAATEAPAAEPASSETYQLCGVYAEDGQGADMMTAAFVLDLNADGSAKLARYKYLSYDASPAATNPSYEDSFMSGTWKKVEKDGIESLQIKIAVVNGDGSTTNDQTVYAYESAGDWSVEIAFPIVPGMSYSRNVELIGNTEKKFADGDAMIAQYKQEFVAPEHVAMFEAEGGNAAYLFEDGKLALYVAHQAAAEGTWKLGEALEITVNGEAVNVISDGTTASFEYSRDRGDGELITENYVCGDITALEKVAPQEAAAPAEDAPYTSVAKVQLGADNAFDATLVLNEDGTAVFTVAMGMNVKYEKLGNVVVLYQDEAAPLEGNAAAIFGAAPKAWILDDETKTMASTYAAYFFVTEQASLAFVAADETTMAVSLPAYGMGANGFTYEVSENTLKVTAPELDGGFAQVWSGLGVDTFTIAEDGYHLTPAA